MLPEGMTSERQRAKYVFNIYRGENVVKIKPGSCCSGPPKVCFESGVPNSYVEIHFVGLKVIETLPELQCKVHCNEQALKIPILHRMISLLFSFNSWRYRYLKVCTLNVDNNIMYASNE